VIRCAFLTSAARRESPVGSLLKGDRQFSAQGGSSDPRLERGFCHILSVLPALSKAEGSAEGAESDDPWRAQTSGVSMPPACVCRRVLAAVRVEEQQLSPDPQRAPGVH